MPTIEELMAIAGPPDNADLDSMPLSEGSVTMSYGPTPGGQPAMDIEALKAIAGPPDLTTSDYVAAGASGYLDGVAGMLDFGEMLVNPTRTFLPEAAQTRSFGDLFRRGVDTVSGVPNSTRIGEGTAINTAASYLPQAVLGPESILKNAISTLFTAGGAGIGRELGGDTGEIIGSLTPTVAGLAVGAGKNVLQKAGSAMERKSIGARASDYGSASGVLTVETPTGDVESFTKTALDDLLQNNKLGSSRDPSKMLTIIKDQKQNLSGQIDQLVDAAESAGTKGKISFGNALNYIQDNVPAESVDKYLNRLNRIQSATTKEGKGSLKYLQDQKKAYGTRYNPTGDSVEAGFDRALYHDFKESVEAASPEIKGLNQELRKYIVAEPIINRSLVASEGASPASKLRDLGYTTGGIGAPTVVGSVLGGPVGTAVGATIGLGTRAAASPRGQSAIGSTIREIGKDGANIPRAATNINELLSNTKSSKPPTVEKPIEKKNQPSTPAKELLKTEIPSVKKIVERIDSDPVDSAIFEMESSRGKNLKNPDSSARGAFQLLSSTSKKLGVEDPMDLAQNYEGYLKLKEENVNRFGDNPETIYATHYLGATVFNKLLKGQALNAKERTQVETLRDVLLPKFRKIYTRIANKMVDA